MREKSLEIKRRILKESFSLFRKNGYENTTTRQIAETCGIKRGLLSYYYPQKQDILFEIYRDYLTEVVEFVKETYPGEEAMTMSCLSNMLFYRVIEEDQDSKKLLYSILENRELRKFKITKSMEIYQAIYKSRDCFTDERQLLLSSTLTIGAEAELVLSVRDGQLELSDTDLAFLITHINFSTLGVPDQEIKHYCGRASELFQKLDTMEFRHRMKEHVYWYTY